MISASCCKSALRLNDLSVQAHIGWPSAERAQPQELRISIELRFREAPRAESSDDLSDSICYGALADELRALAQSREFKLIERFAYACFETATRLCAGRAFVGVVVRKPRAPVEGLLGGSSYACGDFLIA